MLRGKINKVDFEEVKQLKNKKPDVNSIENGSGAFCKSEFLN